MAQSQQEQFIAQAAAIPYRIDRRTGQVEVLLIRRRDPAKGKADVKGKPDAKAKWGIPKGSVDPGLNHEDAAHMEAMQEAGVDGPLSDEPVGAFTYAKYGGTCLVQVYAMRVTKIRDHWDEDRERLREWFPILQAAGIVGREAVGRLIRRLATQLKKQ
jgi:8-oxo-dGTP pyrophosphatase MutT (NUDIX family)